jgi:hypothetical protein
VTYLRVRFNLEVEVETDPSDDGVQARTYDAVHAALRTLRVPGASLEGYTLRSRAGAARRRSGGDAAGVHEGSMKNLAGAPVEDATLACSKELAAAGIGVVMLDAVPNREVKSLVIGKLGNIEFTRAWYYWMAHGKVPLEVAKRLYEDPIGKTDVRVNGNCTCPAPGEPGGLTENYDADGRDLCLDPDGSQEVEWNGIEKRHPEFAKQRPRFVRSFDGLDVRRYVTVFHIDSEAGLRLFADAVRNLPEAP